MAVGGGAGTGTISALGAGQITGGGGAGAVGILNNLSVTPGDTLTYTVGAGGAGNNVGVGKDAMMNISSGVENVAVGDQSGYSLSTGGYNVAIGSDAFRAATTANYNVAIGKNAMNTGVTTSPHNIGLSLIHI